MLLPLLLNTGLSFVALAVVFGLLERAYPARRGQPLLRPDYLTDLCYFLGQYLLWPGVMIAALSLLRRHVHLPGAAAGVARWPFWLQAVAVVLGSDVIVYFGHRLQHRSAWLWRFHAVHHSAEHLDWLAAHREHPLDGLYTQALVNLPALVLGFPPEALAGLAAFRGMWAIYIHANVRLPTGPLRVLLGAPELHHWHHSRERFPGNYANVSPLMDVVFGTYRCPPGEPEALGLEDPMPRGYLAQLARPFLRQTRYAAPDDRDPGSHPARGRDPGALCPLPRRADPLDGQ